MGICEHQSSKRIQRGGIKCKLVISLGWRDAEFVKMVNDEEIEAATEP